MKIPQEFITNQSTSDERGKRFLIRLPVGAQYVEGGKTTTVTEDTPQLDPAFLENIIIEGQTYDELIGEPVLTNEQKKVGANSPSTFDPSIPITSTQYVKSGDGKFLELVGGAYQRVGDANTLKKLETGKLEATNVFYTGDQLLGKEPLPSGDVSGALAVAQGGATGGTSAQGNQALQDIINQAGLNDDQKSAIDLIYEAIASNDKDLMERAKAAMAAATEFSEPFFKAQARLAIDTLDRSLTGREDDLAFREEQISSALGDLRNDIQSAGDFLSFQQQQELKGLERQYDQNLKVTQEDLAARGFTQSSVRSRKEQLLTDTFGDLRQSSDRSFTEKQTQLTNQQTRADRDTTAEIERLRELTEKGKIDDLRKTEQYLGTDALRGVGYNDNLLGDLPGDIERQKLSDATSFASGSGLIF